MFRSRVLTCAFVATVAAMAAAPLRGDDGIAFFESKVRPVLVQHCYKCHSEEAAEAKGGLKVDRREAIRRGGDSGPAVVPGKPEESLLLSAVACDGSFVDMPPSGPLPAHVVADLRKWVTMGAPDPREKAEAATMAWDQVLAARRTWWSLQPVVRPAVPPPVDNQMSSHPIDRFLQAGWTKAGIEPAPEADPRTLMLRAHFILTGLPPTPEEVEEFVRSFSPSLRPSLSPSSEDGETERQRDGEKAYEVLLDELLASPHFGERWARHWMDLVRYKETHGSEHDPLIPHAYRYRDYLIRAFNDDVPYDRFVQEQLAGDLLPPRYHPETGLNESLAATMFFRCVEFYPTPVDVKAEEITVVDAQIDMFGKAFQALTISCARCHDHKFDAVSARDYYALYGIFAGARTTMHSLDRPEALRAHDPELRERLPAVRQAVADLWSAELPHWPKRIAAAAARLQPEAPPLEKLDDKALAVDRDAMTLREAAKQPASPLFAVGRLATFAKSASEAQRETMWKQVLADERRSRVSESFRDGSRYRLFADFTTGNFGNWYRTGTFEAAEPGSLIVQPTGAQLVTGIMPRGLYTNLLSDKHSGALRSPNFTIDMPSISVLVCGTNKSRVRLIVENFQGDDLLFRQAGAKPVNGDLHWETLQTRPNWQGRRAYLELMPRDDMTYPGKIADAASVATDGRSGIGVRAVVFHDGSRPAPEPTLPEAFYSGTSATDVVQALSREAASALESFREGTCNDRQAALLDGLLRAGFLPNTAAAEHPASRTVVAYREVETRVPVPYRVPGVVDGDGVNERLFLRGDYHNAKEVVPRRYLEALDDGSFEPAGSGRLQLARELTDGRNPLTARVMVNRLWRHVFGEGLVRSVDNFGQLGELPSHPELLDRLAAEFVDEGWSTKRMLKRMLTSRAFRQSAAASPKAVEVDPENRLWSHASVRRLDAEMIRDRLLWASGRLDPKMFGLGVPLPVNEAVKDFDVPKSGPLDGAGRRSVYLEMRHNYPPSLLIAFDQPRPVDTVGRRDATNVPAQSLALLNDPVVHEQASLLARRVAKECGDDVDERIRRLYAWTLCREPTSDELRGARAFIGTRNDERSWQALAHALFNFKEFIYLR